MSTAQRLQRHGANPRRGIVHLGPGAFFKAFNAVYTDEVLAHRGGDWGIVAVSLRSDRALRELGPQNGAYTSVSLESSGPQIKVIHSICDVIVAPQEPERVLRAMADPEIKIVSLTITEKGYCHHPSTGDLRLDDAGIRHDLENPHAPQTAIGFITQALAERRRQGLRPFTVLSCDNLPDNGAIARRVVLAFARQVDPSLADWIEKEGRFPATMVDRITPATTQADIDALTTKTGVLDMACVQHEAFRQWVIEDNFVDGARPAWDQAGAQFVANVTAHEAMKLRCLNGTHSTLAYLGYLAGYETIAETVSDEVFATLCQRLWAKEIVPTLVPPQGENLADYTKRLLARYQNTAIRHRTWQIAMDGSQKLPQRILGTIQDGLGQGMKMEGLCLTVAAWMHYVGGRDFDGAAIDVRDPIAGDLAASFQAGSDATAKVANILSIRSVFPEALAQNDAFRVRVLAAFVALRDRGVRQTVQDYIADAL